MKTRPYWTAIALLLAASAAAEDSAREWLERMGSAVDTLTYRGTFVHSLGPETETFNVTRRVREGVISERLNVTGGRNPREIIRTDEHVKCILPQSKVVVVERRKDRSPLTAALPRYTQKLDASYALRLAAEEKVAQRWCRVLLIQPKDKLRYGYRLWLDRETAMPLRYQLVATSGEIAEQIMFTDFELAQDFDDEKFVAQSPTGGFAVHEEGDTVYVETDTDETGWQAELPEGFELIRRSDSSDGTEHLMFSDTLASVSVFIEESGDDDTDRSLQGLSKVGASNAYGTRSGRYQITVVGEVPEDTVQMIGNSMRARPRR